ncbi:MAG: DUF1570 domain-containing protein, partial [Planctomycetota bacterium]
PIITPHYRIWCNSTLEVAQYYADTMEELYKAYDKVFKKQFFPRINQPPGSKSDVWIHASHRQFMDWTGVPPGIGGFYNILRQDVTAYHGSFGATGSTEEVLAHEGTHQFEGLVFKNFWSVPIWIIEGLAVYFGDGSKIDRHSVKINEIPRDRLVGLQAAIEDRTYCPLNKLIRLPQPRFTGFHYAHAWGIIYWCLHGNKIGAHNGSGLQLFEEYLLRCKDLSGRLDSDKEARHFERLLVEYTGKSIEVWEEEYKKWILGLPLEPLGKRRSGRWISERLGFEVAKPPGWDWVRVQKLRQGEVVATRRRGSQKRRISSLSWPNLMHGELSESLVANIINNAFQNLTYEEGGDPRKTTVHGYDAIEVVFTGEWVVSRGGNVGGGQGEESDEKPAQPTEKPQRYQYRVVAYATPDKIYANVLEVTPAAYEGTQEAFERYLESFKIYF